MTVYGEIKVALPTELWTLCSKCVHGSDGRVIEKCTNRCCSGGFIKYKIRRASKIAIQDAENSEDSGNVTKGGKRK